MSQTWYENAFFLYLFFYLRNQRGWHQKAKMPAQKASFAHRGTVSIRERRHNMMLNTIL
jgi:hypothetical protein